MIFKPARQVREVPRVGPIENRYRDARPRGLRIRHPAPVGSSSRAARASRVDADVRRVRRARIGAPSDAPAGPSTAPSASPPPPPLATLAEAYDVYVNLARTGLWFDVNPRWHARLGVYYLRCEPNAAAASRRPPNDDDAPTRREPDERPPPTVVEPANDAGAIPPPPPPDDARRHPHPPPVPPRPSPPPRTRQVTVPVASSRAALDPKRLRDLAALGDEWLSETRDGDVAYAAAVDEEPRAAERDEGKEGPRANDATALRASSSSPLLAPPRFDARRAVPTNLALIDTDGTMVVIGIERGLIEPEDLEPPPEHGGSARGGGVGGRIRRMMLRRTSSTRGAAAGD